MLVVFCKQKMSYELRISDWSSDVCSSDLNARFRCRIRSPKRSSPNTPPTSRRLRQRPERRNVIGADTAMVRPLGLDRKGVEKGKGGTVSVDLGGRLIIKQTTSSNVGKSLNIVLIHV